MSELHPRAVSSCFEKYGNIERYTCRVNLVCKGVYALGVEVGEAKGRISIRSGIGKVRSSLSLAQRLQVYGRRRALHCCIRDPQGCGKNVGYLG